MDHAHLLSGDEGIRTFLEAFDALGLPVALVTRARTEAQFTPRFRAAIITDADHEVVLRNMLSLATSMTLSADGVSTAASSVATAEVRTGAATYLLRAVRMSPDIVVMALDHFPIVLPSADELTRRFRLTAREAEVALLLADGKSDREIAAHLRISPHTARKHSEHIFEKLDLHSRKALALRLTRDR